jgi:hypothetical protein
VLTAGSLVWLRLAVVRVKRSEAAARPVVEAVA